MKKICKECRKEKDIKDFYFNKQTNLYFAKCAECIKDNTKRWKKLHPGHTKAWKEANPDRDKNHQKKHQDGLKLTEEGRAKLRKYSKNRQQVFLASPEKRAARKEYRREYDKKRRECAKHKQ